MDGVLCYPRNEENGGASGGLCFLWKVGVSVTFISSSFFHIDVMVKWEDGYDCRVTGFYGEPNGGQPHLSWELLRQLARVREGPWLCCGDYNEILHISEKSGPAIRSQRQIDGFRHAIEECGLYEFAFTGYEFTWDNRREGDANVKSRIDRGFGNLALIQKWGGFTSHHLVAYSSDHCPVLIESDPLITPRSVGLGSRWFLFEEMWVTEEGCGKVIEQIWGEGASASILVKIKQVAVGLKSWESEKFGSVRRSIKELREELDGLQRMAPTDLIMRQRREVEVKIDQHREEIMWCQRSRINWLKYGDRNSKFFHQFAKQRGKINRINGILGEDNRWRSDQQEIGGVFVKYFRDLFTAGNGVIRNENFEAVSSRLSEDQVQFMSGSFSRGEVEIALKGMGPTKAPGPDGLPPLFY